MEEVDLLGVLGGAELAENGVFEAGDFFLLGALDHLEKAFKRRRRGLLLELCWFRHVAVDHGAGELLFWCPYPLHAYSALPGLHRDPTCLLSVPL